MMHRPNLGRTSDVASPHGVLCRLAVSACAALAVAALHSTASADDPPGWTQVWNDEFNGATLDQAKWRSWQPSTPGPYNNEQQEYLPSQVAVSGGNLVITATNQPYGNYSYRSGRVESNFAKQYGRFEIRADLPGTKGTWPALWLLPDVDQYPWPTQGEIDILENKGHQPNLTSSAFHFRDPNPPNQHQYVAAEHTAARFGQPVNYHTSFHTYAVEWDATKIRYFVDDVHWYTTYNSGQYSGSGGTTVSGFLGNQTAPMQVVLNLAVGGDFLGGQQQPDGTSVWPQQLLVDYVRILERNDAPIVFRNGDFETNDGSIAHWSEFGNRVNTNNVSVHNESAMGAASLKLFGPFTGGTSTSGVSQGITVAAGDEVRAAAESYIRSQDDLAGNNSVIMRIEFYNEFGGRRNSSTFLNEATLTIANAASPNDMWRPHELSAVAPAGAVEARLALVFQQQNNAGGAIHVDNVSLLNTSLNPAADADEDGDVDADDLSLWRQHFGSETGPIADADADGDVDGADFLVWQRQLGQSVMPLGGQAANGAVPEPWGAVMAAVALVRLILFPSAPSRPHPG